MLSSAILVVAALAVATSASPTTLIGGFDPRVAYGNMNVVMDLFLFNINRQLPDSLPIPDINGPFNMHNCNFVGLQYGIKREGDATLVRTANQAKFVAGLKMQEVGIVCDWYYTVFSGSVSAISANIQLQSGFIWILQSGQHPWLTQFLVTAMDPIKVDMTGLVGVNWLVQDIANWVLAGAQEEITNVIETTLAAEIQVILDSMIIP